MPRKTTPPALNTIELPLDVIQPALAAVIPAASRDDARPVLEGVHIALEGATLVVEATDSYRLHQVRIPYPTTGRFDVIIPAAWLQAIKWPKVSASRRRITPPTVTITVLDGSNLVTVSTGDYSWSGPTVRPDVGYPNTANLLAANPPDDEGAAAFNPAYLNAALKVGTAFTKGQAEPVEVLALHPMKPCRFRALREDYRSRITSELHILLMPVRTHRKPTEERAAS